MKYTVRQHMPPVRSGRRRTMTSLAAGEPCVPAARPGLARLVIPASFGGAVALFLRSPAHRHYTPKDLKLLESEME